MSKTRKFDYMNLWDADTLKGYFCADKAKYSAEQTAELFKKEYRAEMDNLELNGGSAEEYRENAPVITGFVRFGVGLNVDGEPCGGYEFRKEKAVDLYSKPRKRGEFEVWAIKDGTSYDW